MSTTATKLSRNNDGASRRSELPTQQQWSSSSDIDDDNNNNHYSSEPLTIREVNVMTHASDGVTKRNEHNSSARQHSVTDDSSLDLQSGEQSKKTLAPEDAIQMTIEEGHRDENELVTTTKEMLELVLGEVVEIVVDAGESKLDVDRLQQLFHQPEEIMVVDDEEKILLSHKELNLIVMRVVVPAKESVRRGTKKPTGIHISDLGFKRGTVSLSWASAKQTEVAGPSTLLCTEKPNGHSTKDFVLSERILI